MFYNVCDLLQSPVFMMVMTMRRFRVMQMRMVCGMFMCMNT